MVAVLNMLLALLPDWEQRKLIPLVPAIPSIEARSPIANSVEGLPPVTVTVALPPVMFAEPASVSPLKPSSS